MKHPLDHAFFPIVTPDSLNEFFDARYTYSQITSQIPRAVVSAPHASAPIVHRNAICDVCDSEVIGVRHKCLDCPDYDMCSRCYDSDARSRHPLSHAFFAIERPGEVLVHTIFTGDGERSPEARACLPSPRRGAVENIARTASPVTHNAICNLCDSRIRGDRFVSPGHNPYDMNTET